MDDVGQIIAIGGGGFGRNPNQLIIEEYMVKQSEVEKPKICFIPTASAEDKAYTVNFYTAFSKLNSFPTHINFFQRTPSLRSILKKQDVIYVGGGNTKSMLAVWREWKLDQLLLKAYGRGAILCGVSAGAICWFSKGVTDSWSDSLKVMDCLNFIDENCCPHYNGEKERQPTVHKYIKEKILNDCICIDDGAAVHYKGGGFFRTVSFMNNASSYLVTLKDDKIYTEEMLTIKI